jgi:hypothetical protein
MTVMFAIDHAATALVLKRRFPSVSWVALLFSVQAMELAWVGLNYLGVERVTTKRNVRSVADIKLSYMPWSHSLAVPLGAAGLARWALARHGGRALGRSVALGILSHLLLDVVTHDHDIVPWPGRDHPKLGLGLYGTAPMAAFALELGYGVVCWRLAGGGRGLLALIVGANLANVTMFSEAIPGPERLLAGAPRRVVTFVFAQIVATLAAVGALGRRALPEHAAVAGAALQSATV